MYESYNAMERLNEQIAHLRREGGELSGQVRERVFGYILAALGLVAGLAWNDAIKALIESIFPLESNTVLAKFVYAVVLTVVVVIVTVYLINRLKGGVTNTEENQ